MYLRAFGPICAVVLGLGVGGSVAAEPIFPSSVTSNDLDFIHGGDQSVQGCFEYLGETTQEMPGHPSDELMAPGTFTYEVRYSDGTSVQVWVHSDVQSQANARVLLGQVMPRLGKLPTFMRDTLDHVVIHAGDRGAFAESEGHFFVLYSENMTIRIANNDLEETVFHEAVHATLDAQYLGSLGWGRAQSMDNAFVTGYAASRPGKEDMAESALFAYAMIKNPGRLPPEIEDQVRQIMPNRLAYFEELFAGETFVQVGPAPDC